jgi:hypothetical protein
MKSTINQKPLGFCMWRYASKKYKMDVKGRQLEAPLLFVRGGVHVKNIR